MEENKNTCAEDIKEQEAAEAEADKVELEQEATEEDTEEKLSGKEKRKIKKAEAEIEKLNATIAEEQDKYLRLYAEYDNFRKRSAREREGVYTDAYCDALSQILPVLDNLERAAQFSPEDADSPMAKGLELTLKSFIETMNKMGVYEIEALGKEFDPNFHNAVMQVESDEFESGIVAQELMKGYMYRDSVVRHSMVGVVS